MKQIEFTVGKHTFRNANMTASEALALETLINFDDFSKSKQMFEVIFEHTEVKVVDTWQPMKEKGIETYVPVGIEEDLAMLNRVAITFIQKVMQPLFMSSTESK